MELLKQGVDSLCKHLMEKIREQDKKLVAGPNPEFYARNSIR